MTRPQPFFQTIDDAVQWATTELAQAGIDFARTEADILTAHALEVDRSRLGVLKILREPFPRQAQESLGELIAKRRQRIPLQLILGTAPFYGLDIPVKAGVFIPRPETEVLVETVVDHLQQMTVTTPLRILDLCTGTGAIAVAIADQVMERGIPAVIIAVELDHAAFKLASENSALLGGGLVRVIQGDATNSVKLIQKIGSAKVFDIVVSNPPYIPVEQRVEQPEAIQDPERALYGGGVTGTEIPLQIAATAAELLRPGGFFMMEHDESHADQLAGDLLATGAWTEAKTMKDLTGALRFFVAARSDMVTPSITNEELVGQ